MEHVKVTTIDEIASVFIEISVLDVMGTKEKDGFQIDLNKDRKDATINICELKYYNAPFEINKNYAEVLRNRKQKFIMHNRIQKTSFYHNDYKSRYSRKSLEPENSI